jgi:hypothetical protein
MRTSTCLSHPLSAWVPERWPRSVRGGTCQAAKLTRHASSRP